MYMWISLQRSTNQYLSGLSFPHQASTTGKQAPLPTAHTKPGTALTKLLRGLLISDQKCLLNARYINECIRYINEELILDQQSYCERLCEL